MLHALYTVHVFTIFLHFHFLNGNNIYFQRHHKSFIHRDANKTKSEGGICVRFYIFCGILKEFPRRLTSIERESIQQQEIMQQTTKSKNSRFYIKMTHGIIKDTYYVDE